MKNQKEMGKAKARMMTKLKAGLGQRQREGDLRYTYKRGSRQQWVVETETETAVCHTAFLTRVPNWDIPSHITYCAVCFLPLSSVTQIRGNENEILLSVTLFLISSFLCDCDHPTFSFLFSSLNFNFQILS